MLHPSLAILYKWFLHGYPGNGKYPCALDEIFIMNKHGTLWFCGSGALSKAIRSGNKYRSLLETLND